MDNTEDRNPVLTREAFKEFIDGVWRKAVETPQSLEIVRYLHPGSESAAEYCRSRNDGACSYCVHSLEDHLTPLGNGEFICRRCGCDGRPFNWHDNG